MHWLAAGALAAGCTDGLPPLPPLPAGSAWCCGFSTPATPAAAPCITVATASERHAVLEGTQRQWQHHLPESAGQPACQPPLAPGVLPPCPKLALAAWPGLQQQMEEEIEGCWAACLFLIQSQGMQPASQPGQGLLRLVRGGGAPATHPWGRRCRTTGPAARRRGCLRQSRKTGAHHTRSARPTRPRPPPGRPWLLRAEREVQAAACRSQLTVRPLPSG